MKRMGSQWQVLALVAGLVISVQASAQEESGIGDKGSAGTFGHAGQIVINTTFGGPQFAITSTTPGAALGYESNSEALFISINPSADYFLQENLSVGGSVGLATTLSDGADLLVVALRVRAGYNIPMNEKITVWPQLGLGIGHADIGIADTTFFEVAINAPFLYHIAPNFYIGAGPGLTTILGDDTSVTLGGSTVIGGYF
jgi:opacity protein-like surface antigen